MQLKALSGSQERRLISYLDDQLLSLNRHFETRHSPRAVLPSIGSYLDYLSSLQSFVLTIPPVGASAALRVAYLLHLTALLPDALAAYALPSAALPPLFGFLATFDRAWCAVLSGAPWDTAASQSGPAPAAGDTGVRGTDRVRLDSIVVDVRETLRAMLGLPLDRAPRIALEREGASVLESAYKIPKGAVSVLPADGPEEVGMSCALEEGRPGALETTPSLTTASSSSSTTADGADDAEMSDGADNSDEFEEVDVASPSAANEPSFSISFRALPPSVDPPLPSPERRRGFDPDAEYGMDDEDSEGALEEEDADADDAGLKDQVDTVFSETMARLEELKLQ